VIRGASAGARPYVRVGCTRLRLALPASSPESPSLDSALSSSSSSESSSESKSSSSPPRERALMAMLIALMRPRALHNHQGAGSTMFVLQSTLILT
jgi:hypothetical protein